MSDPDQPANEGWGQMLESESRCECFSCGHVFLERTMPFGGRIRQCPNCGSAAVLNLGKGDDV